MVICGKFCDIASCNRNHGHYLPRSNVQRSTLVLRRWQHLFHLLYIAFVFLAIDTYIPNSTCYLNIISPVHVILTMAIRADFAPTLTFLVCVSPSLSLFHYFSLSLDHVDNVLYSYVSYFVVNPHAHLSHNTKQIYNIFFVLVVVVVL